MNNYIPYRLCFAFPNSSSGSLNPSLFSTFYIMMAFLHYNGISTLHDIIKTQIWIGPQPFLKNPWMSSHWSWATWGLFSIILWGQAWCDTCLLLQPHPKLCDYIPATWASVSFSCFPGFLLPQDFCVCHSVGWSVLLCALNTSYPSLLALNLLNATSMN